jgi:hypothetical protein
MTAEEPYQDMPLMQACFYHFFLNLIAFLIHVFLIWSQVVVSVVRDGMRPPIPESRAASPYAALMLECWNEEPAKRPSFDEICTRLEYLLTELGEKECASFICHCFLSVPLLLSAFLFLPLQIIFPPIEFIFFPAVVA